ncbi:hypothetical protein MU539_10830 [Lacticaseibacillus rhamnosus]|nr:hypothetical protein [Lacticaseibacillus rhamnosus]MDK8383894.1 hypothetical protein [Lacticaseibacillus rhamnosus]UUT37912.1 hypothetical protein MU539_10830 [Lacticaseibacillus rhamnosus]
MRYPLFKKMTIKNDAERVNQMKGGDRRMDYEEELETKGYIDCLLHELHEQPQLIRQTNIEEVVERTKEEIIRDGFHGYELRRHVFRMILRIDFILTTESVRLSQEGRDAIDELRRIANGQKKEDPRRFLRIRHFLAQRFQHHM